MIFMGEKLTQLGTVITSLMFIYAAIQQYLPRELRSYLARYTDKIMSFISPNIHVSFDEYTGDSFKRSEVYVAIQTYLSVNSTTQAKRLKAHDVKGRKSLTLGLDDNADLNDEFQGVKLLWTSYKTDPVNSNFRYTRNIYIYIF